MAPAIRSVSSDSLPGELSPAQWREGLLQIIRDNFGMAFNVGPADASARGVIRMSASTTGPAVVGLVESSTPYGARRTRAHLGLDDADRYRIFAPIQGEWLINQDGRTSRLTPGGVVLLDYSRPYEVRQIIPEVPHRHAFVHLPRNLLPFRAKDIDLLTGTAFTGQRDATSLTIATLHRITADFAKYQAATLNRASAAVVDLLIAALSEQLGTAGSVSPESRKRALLLQVCAFIRANLADPELGVASIAQANHLSTRQLHRLFSTGQEMTVQAWVRQLRLERCRDDLADPALRQQSIAAIAARWGMPDACQFSRTFRREFGQSPTDFRRSLAYGVEEMARRHKGMAPKDKTDPVRVEQAVRRMGARQGEG